MGRVNQITEGKGIQKDALPAHSSSRYLLHLLVLTLLLAAGYLSPVKGQAQVATALGGHDQPASSYAPSSSSFHLATAPAQVQTSRTAGETVDFNIKGHYRHFELDRLGNLFLIPQEGAQITQYNKMGDSINHYDNISSYGQITELDVTNPLKIAVYYRDYSTIVVLDRYLSPVNTIDLRKADIWEAQGIATSYDNQYWVYDKQAAKIKKVDGQGKVTFASSDLRQVFDDGVDPVKMLDRDGLLYAYDPDYGWYIFDYYGALKQKIPVKGLRDTQVAEGVLSARLAGTSEQGQIQTQQLWLMNPGGFAPEPVIKAFPETVTDTMQIFQHQESLKKAGPDDGVRQSLFLGHTGKLLILTATGLRTYTLKL